MRRTIIITALLFVSAVNAQILDRPTQRRTDMSDWGISVQCAVYSTAAGSSYATYIVNEGPNLNAYAIVTSLQPRMIDMFLTHEKFNQETQKLDNSLTAKMLPNIVHAGLVLGINLARNPTIQGMRSWPVEQQAREILNMTNEECLREIKTFRTSEIV